MRRAILLPFLIVLVVGATQADVVASVETTTVALAESATTPDANQPASTESQPAEPQSAAANQDETNPRIGMGLMVGAFYPTSSEVRDHFGDNWVRFGLRPLPLDIPNKWRISWDAAYYHMSYLDDDVTLIPVTVGLIRGYGDKEKTRPYVALNAGVFYGNADMPSLGVDEKGWGLNMNATAGIIFNRRFSIEARYEVFDEFAGMDFSAFTLSAAVKVLEAKF